MVHIRKIKRIIRERLLFNYNNELRIDQMEKNHETYMRHMQELDENDKQVLLDFDEEIERIERREKFRRRLNIVLLLLLIFLCIILFICDIYTREPWKVIVYRSILRIIVVLIYKRNILI